MIPNIISSNEEWAELQIRLKFVDPKEIDNYYIVKAKTFGRDPINPALSGFGPMNVYLESESPIISQYGKPEGGLVFSDKLIHANIYSSETQKGTISNNYGFYSITLPARNIRIHYSYVGYKGITMEFLLNNDTLINIALETSNLLEEIEVRANSIQSNVESSRMSMNRIPVETIKGLPVLLGEIDIIKTIQLLPGVQSGTEGTSGFYVRGGSPDQNLILLDEVPVYNANHLFGFFSVFNNDAINTVNLTKGAFPARYGGRLSSVLDIRMKEGNKSRVKGSGSVGIICLMTVYSVTQPLHSAVINF